MPLDPKKIDKNTDLSTKEEWKEVNQMLDEMRAEDKKLDNQVWMGIGYFILFIVVLWLIGSYLS